MQKVFNKYVNCTLAGCILLFVFAPQGFAERARAEASGDKLFSTPIRVGEKGAVIVDYESRCSESAWLEKQHKGYESIYKKFYRLEDLQNFLIAEQGVYYIYPVTRNNCSSSSITVTYRNNQ